jgi:hypothetical protein
MIFPRAFAIETIASDFVLQFPGTASTLGMLNADEHASCFRRMVPRIHKPSDCQRNNSWLQIRVFPIWDRQAMHHENRLMNSIRERQFLKVNWLQHPLTSIVKPIGAVYKLPRFSYQYELRRKVERTRERR